jgi:Bacterial Ig domain
MRRCFLSETQEHLMIRCVRRSRAIACLLLAFLVTSSFAATTISPNTTLAAETSNNTSAANSFAAQSNGNLGAGNVSKVDVHSLLYSGQKVPIYAHFMPWFGGGNHMNVGYSSVDAAQVKRQVTDMMSRGINGAILDWYGPNHATENNTALALKAEAQTRSGFVFAIMEDAGALSACAKSGCNVTNQLISDLKYAYNTYETSPAYMRVNGQPVVFFFGVEQYAINWNTVKANVPGNPRFVFQNAGGFSHSQSQGAYSWVMINTSNANDWQQNYLSNFYLTSFSFDPSSTFAATYKGFNDKYAAWTQHRVVNQNCGETWVNTWKEINQHFNIAKPLDALQLVTWNDYEEGTEIETGIDNCVSVNGWMTGSTLNWQINGNPSMVHHYTLYISKDGKNLMSLGDVPTGQRSMNLAPFAFANGIYTIYVKAVGLPSMMNHMSAGIEYTVNSGSAPTPTPPPSPVPPTTATGVTVQSPANNSTTTSPVHVVASASAPSGIAAIRIYVDNVSVYTVNASGINTGVTMSKGKHYVVVQAWDNKGNVYKTPLNITAQ